MKHSAERETTQLEFCVKQNYLSSEGEIKTSKKIEGIETKKTIERSIKLKAGSLRR